MEDRKKGLCCPNCGNPELKVISDQNLSGALQGGVAGAMLGGVKQGVITAASHIGLRTHFVCDKCGRRFRNPQELRSEAVSLAKKSKFLVTLSVIMGLISLVMTIAMFSLGVTIVGVFFGLFTAFFALMILISRAQAKKPINELKEIEEGIKRFGGSI